MSIAILLLALVSAGQTDEATLAAKPPTQDVQRLIRQLDDDRLAIREAAESALKKLGPEILASLPSGSFDASAEVKTRLDRVRQALQLQLARQSVEASRISLSGKMDAADAFRAIQEQTGNRFSGLDEVRGSVTLDFDQMPFWIAVDQLMDRVDLTSNAFGGVPNTLALQIRPASQRPRLGSACYEGIFRIAASQISAVRDLRNPSNAGLQVRLAIEWEPRITPITISLPMEKIQAATDSGKKISDTRRRGTLNATVTEDYHQVEVDVPLQLPDRTSTFLASLQGVIEVMSPGRVETFRFEAAEGGSPKSTRNAGVTVTLDRVVRNQDVYMVQLQLQFDQAEDAFESYRGWFYRNEAYLEDADGNRIENDGMQTLAQNDSGVTVAYLFARDELPENGVFVYETPVLITKTAVAFELHNIQLP
jgi:hypothetical protein